MKYSCKIKSKNKILNYDFSDRKHEENFVLAELNDGRIIRKGNSISLIGFQENIKWQTFLKENLIPREVHFTEKTILLVTYTKDYHAWGFMGPIYFIDKSNGEIFKEVKGKKAKVLNTNSFLVGLEGYDYFDTWLYGDNGEILQRWKSYGHYFPKGNDILVFEKDRRIPTNSHISYLKKDGSIIKAIKLKDAQVPKPILLGSNNILYVDLGVVTIIDFKPQVLLTETLLAITERELYRFTTTITEKNGIYLISIVERDKDKPSLYSKTNWELELTKINYFKKDK